MSLCSHLASQPTSSCPSLQSAQAFGMIARPHGIHTAGRVSSSLKHDLPASVYQCPYPYARCQAECHGLLRFAVNTALWSTHAGYVRPATQPVMSVPLKICLCNRYSPLVTWIYLVAYWCGVVCLCLCVREWCLAGWPAGRQQGKVLSLPLLGVRRPTGAALNKPPQLLLL